MPSTILSEPFSTADSKVGSTGETNQSVKDSLLHVFKEAHLDLLLYFVILYAILSYSYAACSKHTPELTISLYRLFDYVLLGVLVLYCVYLYWTSDEYTKTHSLDVFMQWCYDFYDDPLMIFSTMLFIMVFTAISFALGIPDHNPSTPFSVIIISHKGWYLLYTQLIHNILKYFFGIDVIRYLRNPGNYYTDGSAASGGGNTLSTPVMEKKKEEVFHVGDNVYTYNDAAAVCKSLDSRLATYEELEQAYSNGGEWCSYGWSDHQMALFPTQKKTWNLLQKNPATKHSCGRPGINGGFIRNANTKYGVNCFGVKPKDGMKATGIMPNSAAFMEEMNYAAKQDATKVDEWKNKLDQLEIHPFRENKWNA
jgi:hypothetical protein